MKNPISRNGTLRRVTLGVALVGLGVVAFAGISNAMPPRHDERAWHAHEVRAYHHWHPPHPLVVEQAPAVYAPPVVYAPPPPVESGINLVIPLHFN